MTAVSRDYDRLIVAVLKRHRKLFPTHQVSADEFVVWCDTCKKGICSETDGPHPENTQN